MLPFANPPSETDDGHDSIGAGGAKGVSTGSAAVLMGTQDKHELLLRIAGDEDEGEGEAARLQTCTIRFFLEPLAQLQDKHWPFNG